MSHANHKWLWCDDNAKVTTWFLSLSDHHDYNIFYASFINTANRSWEISVDKSPTAKKLRPLDRLIVDCLQEKSIPADMLIEALRTYNKFIGGTKGALKGTGLIKFGSVAPVGSEIQHGETRLYNQIAGYYKWPKIEMSKETEDTVMEDEQETHHAEFEIAIVGGRRMDEDTDMA